MLPRFLLLALLTPGFALADPPEPLGLVAVDRTHAASLRPLDLLVEGGTRDILHVHVTGADREALSAAGIPFSLLTEDIQTLRPADLPRGGYHTPADISAELRILADLHPDIARVVDLGRSWEGRELTGIVLTDLPRQREPDEPSYRVLGTHHGDEWSSMEVAFSVAVALADGYGEDPAITTLLDTSEVWVLPVVNPDGVVAFTRRNSRGVDLNRNYSYQWQSSNSAGTGPFSERESDAVRVFSRQRSFAHSLSMHSGATNLGWVWNYTYDAPAHEPVLEDLCARYEATNTTSGFYITNGADWYPTNGDTNDWSYGARGGHDYTLELTDTKAPPADEIEDYVAEHLQASLDFLVDGSLTGARGRVTVGGVGAEATITSASAPWPTYADPETGAWAMPLPAGEHVLTIEAPGGVTTTRTVVVGGVGAGAVAEDLDLASTGALALTEVEGLTADPEAGGTARLCGPAVTHVTDGGTFELSRAGLGPWPLATSFDDGCVALDLDVSALPDWQRVGEWTLVARDDADAEVAAFPLAVLVASPGSLTGAPVARAEDDAATWLLGFAGADLPTGAEVRLVGPDAVRRLPMEALPDVLGPSGEVNEVSGRFDPTGWPEGPYSVRILGRGAWSDGGMVLYEGGAFVPLQSPGDDDDATGDDDDSAPGDDDDTATDDDDVTTDDDDSAPGDDDDRACSGCEGGSGSGTLSALALLLLSPLRRRRTRS